MKYIILMLGLILTINLQAHCQVPCGIYDDNLRMDLIKEHAKTIEKAMNKIIELQKGKNLNQLIRWVNTKEEHANKIQNIVTQYFMAQRIKAKNKNYVKQLKILHKLLVLSMKAKQSVDLIHVKSILQSLKEFQKVYHHHSH